MSNFIDTSEETVNAEFDEAAKELGIDEQQPENPEGDSGAVDEMQRQAEIEIAKVMIGKALKFTVSGLVKVEVTADLYDETAEAYAVLIVKHFPGGLFAFLDKYKEEIAAGTATFVLVGAVRKAAILKQAEKREAEAEQARQQHNKPEQNQFDIETKPEGANHDDAQ